MRDPLVVLAPTGGEVVALVDVPDPVFAEAMVGPGVALRPAPDVGATVVAPVAGTLAAVRAHAVVVSGPDARDVLVHVGLETARLDAARFVALAGQGEVVDAGEPVLRWDPAAVAAAGASTLCPVVALQAEPADLELLAAPGATVRAGDPLLRWR